MELGTETVPCLRLLLYQPPQLDRARLLGKVIYWYELFSEVTMHLVDFDIEHHWH